MTPTPDDLDDRLPDSPAEGELTVRINAFTGELDTAEGSFGTTWRQWALGTEAGAHEPSMLAPQEEPSLEDWTHRGVGWGVVLPRSQSMTEMPDPIRRLIEERRDTLGRVPVFHPFSTDDPNALVMLEDLEAGNAPAIDGSPTGVDVGAIPAYLLICGTPREISWELQETLAQSGRFVGRLDLDEQGLGRYINHLLTGWSDSEGRLNRTVTWAVRHSVKDITHLLRLVLTRPLHRALQGDSDIGEGAVFLDGRARAVSGADLRDALVTHRPLFVATSSHGQTLPLDNLAVLGRDLGKPVDQNLDVLDVAELLSHWQPDGAVWFCHACCSAGSKKTSAYDGLFAADDEIGRMLSGVAKLGDQTAPLPQALLGAEKPLRAFIGQVEPTFDWTLRHPQTDQKLAAKLIKPLYTRLFLKKPVGLTLADWHRRSASLNDAWIKMRNGIRNGKPLTSAILYPRLAAADVASTVLLGDPTAAFA